MRDALTSEQWEYLVSLGVQPPPGLVREAAAPAAASAPVSSPISRAPVATVSSGWRRFLAFLLLMAVIALVTAVAVAIAVLLFSGQRAQGAVSPSFLKNVALSQEQDPGDGGNDVDRLDQLEAQLADMQAQLRRTPSRSQLARIQAQVQGLRTQFSAMRAEIQASRNDSAGAMNALTARLEDKMNSAEAAHAESAALAASHAQRLEATIAALQAALERQQRDGRRDDLILGGGVLLTVLWVAVLQFRRRRAVGLPQANPAPYPSLFDEDSGESGAAPSTGKDELPELPGGAQETPMAFTETGSSEPWTMGLASIKGNVRAENQDYGLCLRGRGYEVMVIADGLGGVPLGQAASRCAVQGAVEAIQGMIPTIGQEGQSLQAIASLAMDAASKALQAEGEKRRIATIADGLRTTLIIVIANTQQIAFSYIGDGGGVILGADGLTTRFVQPQKVAANILQASLGPVVQGAPVCGILVRQPGDLLIVGTDGVFDAVDEAFIEDVMRTAHENLGDLQRTAEQIVQELASFRDGLGFVCDDNMTLGLLGGRLAPAPSGAKAAAACAANVMPIASKER